MKTKFSVSEDKKSLTVERTFDAPKSKVWAAHSDPKLLAQWWGPTGWETSIKHMEFKEGGHWHYAMKCTDKAAGEWYGMVSWGKGIYGKIDPQDFIEVSDLFCDENGVDTPGMPASTGRISFVEKDGKTTVISRRDYATAAALEQVLKMGMQEGMDMSLNNLEAILAK